MEEAIIHRRHLQTRPFRSRQDRRYLSHSWSSVGVVSDVAHGWTRSVMRRGLRWPWIGGVAPPLHGPHGRPSPSHSLTVRVRELLQQNIIEQAHGGVFLNSLFDFPKRESTDSRLVPDLSFLNKHILTFKFGMLSVARVRLALSKGCALASVILKDAYRHVPFHTRFRPFLAYAMGSTIF